MADEPGLFEAETDPKGPEDDAPSAFFRLAAAAEEALDQGRIGRPRGARNRKSKAFEEWYFAKGYKDPAQFLGELITADPIALRRAIGSEASVLDVVNLQRAAAGELMPYLHGKKTPDLSVSVELLPTLIINTGLNQVDQARAIGEQKVLSIGSPLVEGEASKIKDLEGGE